MGKRLDIPLPKSDLELVLILDKVSHPGNLGAVCRAMMNFGFTKLRLINPQCSPDDEEARIGRSMQVLSDHATVLNQWRGFDDCQLIIGTSEKRF